MPLLPTISTFLIVLSAILIAIGWTLIVKGRKKEHRTVMILAALSALLFFIIYMSRTIFVGNTSFGGPDELKTPYTIFLVFHIFLATTGGIFGLVTLTLAFKRKISKHRKWGPVTSIVWFFTAITGVVVYFLLYILYEGGETTSMLKAILGT
ncbi:DUF420 domain-containing protein [Bacillaceae bacterium S4-13-56]